MKKVFFSLAMLLAAQVATAQTVITNNYDSPVTKAEALTQLTTQKPTALYREKTTVLQSTPTKTSMV